MKCLPVVSVTSVDVTKIGGGLVGSSFTLSVEQPGKTKIDGSIMMNNFQRFKLSYLFSRVNPRSYLFSSVEVLIFYHNAVFVSKNFWLTEG